MEDKKKDRCCDRCHDAVHRRNMARQAEIERKAMDEAKQAELTPVQLNYSKSREATNKTQTRRRIDELRDMMELDRELG